MYQLVEHEYICQNPVLLIFFNRIDTTEITLKEIRKVKPPRIYLACDGARNDEEAQKIQSVREQVLSLIDWQCEVFTRFLDKNVGCKVGVSSAITWLFENEKNGGIILEDDCVPNVSFFRFCDEMLERYKDAENVFMVSGWSNLDFAPNISVDNLAPKATLQEDYYFSKYSHIWGWATWARAWAKCSFDINNLESNLQQFDFCSKDEEQCWRIAFEYCQQDRIDAWSYYWLYTIWQYKGLYVYPKNNMIKNIGFNRPDSAHTTESYKLENTPVYDLTFPLKHPKTIEQNKWLDEINYKTVFHEQETTRQKIKRIRRKIKYKIIAAFKKKM